MDEMTRFLEQFDHGENSQYLFHYCKLDQRKFDSILKSQIYLDDVRNFNDPYELHYLHTADSDDWAEQAKDYCKENDLPYDQDTFQKFIDRISSDPVERETAMIRMAENYSVCCFSRELLNPIMWAHYADNHKGICLIYGFDLGIGEGNLVGIPDLDGKQISMFLDDVSYQDTFPVFSAKKDPNTEMKNRKILSTKGKVWEYEKEVRIVSKRRPGLGSIKEKSLKGICFGLRFPKLSIEMYVSFLQKRFSWLKFYQIEKEIKTYEIKVFQL